MAARKRRGAGGRRETGNLSALASSALEVERGQVKGQRGGGKKVAAKKPMKMVSEPSMAEAKKKAAAKAARKKLRPAKMVSGPSMAEARKAAARKKPAKMVSGPSMAEAKKKAAAKAARAAEKAAAAEAERKRQERLKKARARARAKAAEKKRLAEEAERKRQEKLKRERRRRLDAKRRRIFEGVYKRGVKSGEIVLPKRGAIFDKGNAYVSCRAVRLFRDDVRGKGKTQAAFIKKMAREVEAHARARMSGLDKKAKFKFWISVEFLAYKKGNLRGDTVATFSVPKVSRVVALQRYQTKPVTMATLGSKAEWLFDQVSSGSELFMFSVCVGVIPPAEDERARQRRILKETFKKLVADGEIELPRGTQITRNDNYGESFIISHMVELTLPDLVEQMEDVVATCVSSADELNDYIRALPEAVQSQSLPRFWTTFEFFVFDKARRRGSPKTFFVSTDKGQEEIAQSYDGHPQVYFDEYEEAVRRMFEEVVHGPEILIYAIHVGGTFKGLKKKRRRKRGKRGRGRRGKRVAQRQPQGGEV